MKIVPLLILSILGNTQGQDNTIQYAVNENVSEIVEYVLLNDKNHPCARKCVKNAVPMTCRYNFTLEYYDTLSKACYNCPFDVEDCFREHCIPADGIKRPVLVVNRQMPGPSIEVCLGDEVIIDVSNQLGSESTSIHWHGHHQRNSPYMDGVPYVTQCPIPPGTTFRYHFDVENAGTHFWHSHSGFQRADGAFGPFIVRRPDEDNPHVELYDHDLSAHTITLLDWGKKLGLDKFVAHHHNDGDNKPTNLLVNGLGRLQNGKNESVLMPTARFIVEQGSRYRFRVINGGFLNCPIEISVDNHTLLAISTDGNDFQATEVQSIVTYAGERFDFVLKADQPKDVYWMRFSGLMDCDQRFTSAHQEAVLEYKNSQSGPYPNSSPTYESSKKEGKQINTLNIGTEKNSSLQIAMPQLHSLEPWDVTLKPEADFQYYVSYDFYKIDNPHFHKFPMYGFNNVTNKKQQLLTPQLNHISMKLLDFPMLSQRDQIDKRMLCNESTVEKCEEDYCECTHVVNIALGSVVEMILIDKGFAYDANHPFHLHGHSFRVVAMEKIGKTVNVSEVLHRDRNGQIKRNLEDPPLKDTVTVPDGGYTIVRFRATNPGYWLLHCHIEFHVEVGMALVFKIGSDEEMPPVPRRFPKCGDYLPTAKDMEGECDDEGFLGLKVFKKFISGNKECRNSGRIERVSDIFKIVPLILVCIYLIGL